MVGSTVKVLALAISVLTCAGCAGKIDVSGAILTSGASLQAGKRVEVSHFTSQDFVTQLVDFSWSNVEQSGGTHRVTWKWYKNDVLVSETPSRYLTFSTSPFTLHTTRAAATLGNGNFSVETLVDSKVVATSHFDIAT